MKVFILIVTFLFNVQAFCTEHVYIYNYGNTSQTIMKICLEGYVYYMNTNTGTITQKFEEFYNGLAAPVKCNRGKQK